MYWQWLTPFCVVSVAIYTVSVVCVCGIVGVCVYLCWLAVLNSYHFYVTIGGLIFHELG